MGRCMCSLGGASYCCRKSLVVLERGQCASSLKKKSYILQPKKMAPTASATVTAEAIQCSGEANAQKNESLASQWSVKVCHDYFEKRPWPWVMEFYSLVVAGHLSFYDLRFKERSTKGYTVTRGESIPNMPSGHENVARICSEKERGGKWERRTFRALLSYYGASFVGWQRQPGLSTVQGVVEKALGRFVDGKRARALSEEGKDPEANISVAGRTDKGVHAVGQVCSFYTWMRDVQPWEVEAAINAIEPHKLRALHVEEVCRTFHPNFSAKWRRYIYLLPLLDEEAEDYISGDNGFLAEEKKIDVERVNRMLRKLEGHNLSYAVFARDTQSSRSRGTATMCTIFHARASVAELPLLEQNPKKQAHVICVEIVADRFLRKMVRVLVATSIREAVAGAPDTALLMMTESTCRRDSAPPAPASGLCLAEVGYEDMKEARLLIH